MVIDNNATRAYAVSQEKSKLYVLSLDNQKIEKTVDWLREKVKEAGCKGLVVGVSGGIDSAVVCYLIKKAFPDNSIGVIMSINSNPKDREDALKVINGSNGLSYLLTDPFKVSFSLL